MPIWIVPNGALWYGATQGTAATTAPLYLSALTTATTATNTTIVWAGNTNLVWQLTPGPTQRWETFRTQTNRAVDEYLALEHRVYAESAARAEQRSLLRRQAESAKRRARDLLMEHLSETQRETFIKHQWFIVEGGQSKQRYRIRERDSLVANVDVLYESAGIKERVMYRLCGHLDPRTIPLHDHLLAQKLSLEFDEDAFLRIANRHAA